MSELDLIYASVDASFWICKPTEERNAYRKRRALKLKLKEQTKKTFSEIEENYNKETEIRTQRPTAFIRLMKITMEVLDS